MIFKTIVQPEVKVDELVLIYLMEGKVLAGIVDKIDKKYIWLKSSKKEDAVIAKFNLKVNQIVKVN